MLARLSISNFLLIESLELDWQKGLTAITGETGSGKSILIGALELAMGGRADGSLLRDPQKRCAIELELDLRGADVKDWFGANEIAYEELTILRRQLDPGGRSRAFVNDTPVRLEQLRELGLRLVHVHSQHHTLLLNDARFQLSLVDVLAHHSSEVTGLRDRYDDWKRCEKELMDLRDEEARSRSEYDYLKFQQDELELAALQEGEQEALEQSLRQAEHAGERAAAFAAIVAGTGDESGALSTLNKLRSAVSRAASVDPGLASLLERIDSTTIELKDIGDEAARLADAVETDPSSVARVRERLDLLLRLQQKHRVRSSSDLLAVLGDLRQRTSSIGSLGHRIADAERIESEAARAYDEKAKVISRARTKAVKPLANKVESILHELGMMHAVFQFEHRIGEPGPLGIDRIRAMFSANKDRAPAPLDKVASGGELSRVMLALISLAAGTRDLPTVVFDEIDTGVSGEVADRVGTLLAAMGTERQVIAITHLPQIASKAQHQLQVNKDSEGDRVRTSISVLTGEGRVAAIARMLSGRKTTAAALQNAKDLLSAK